VNALQKSALAVVGIAALAAAPAPKAKTPPPPQGNAPRAFAPIFEKERYDSVLSLNDRCPVRHGRLNTNIRPTYINRQPVGFC